MIQPFHPDDLKRLRELTYLRSSAEAYFLLGVAKAGNLTIPLFA